MQYVTVTNPTDGLLMLAGAYLFPGESRAVHPALAAQALADSPALVIVDAEPSLAGEPEDTDGDKTADDKTTDDETADDETADDETADDETADENAPELTALASLSKAELVVLAEEKGLEVGRATKSEIIELIEAAE
jgi:hypothetical protein